MRELSLPPLCLRLILGLLAAGLASDLALAQSCATYTLSSATGNLADTVTLDVTLDSTCTSVITGWSYGVCDPPSAVVTSIVEGAATLTVNNGMLPDFNQLSILPGGFTVGVVVSILGSVGLPAGTGYHLNSATYALIGPPGVDTVCFCSNLGSPPAPTAVVVGITDTPTTNTCGTIETVGVGFVRGDCEASGTVNLADAISLIGILFPTSPTGVPPICPDACDCNDDETLSLADIVCILNSLFGMPPGLVPPPFSTCGVDPSGIDLGCDTFPSC